MVGLLILGAVLILPQISNLIGSFGGGGPLGGGSGPNPFNPGFPYNPTTGGLPGVGPSLGNIGVGLGILGAGYGFTRYVVPALGKRLATASGTAPTPQPDPAGGTPDAITGPPPAAIVTAPGGGISAPFLGTVFVVPNVYPQVFAGGGPNPFGGGGSYQ